MKNIKLLFLGLAVTGMGLSSCKKEAGPAGPAGAAGNANVKSVSFNTQASDWDGDIVNGYTANFNAPIITSGIVSTGVVLCYISWFGENYALPYSYLYNGYTRHMLFNYELNNLSVSVRDDDGLTSNPGDFSAVVKIVAISSTGLIANPNLDLTDYNAVADAFDLK